MTPRRSRLGGVIAALFIRGVDAPYLLRDLDDAFHLDVSRGLTPSAARRRDLRNVLASAASLWAESLRPSAWRPSLLDLRLGVRSIVKTPLVSAVAACALAIGIPVGLAPWHAVDVLERPLPGDPEGRIHTLCYWRDTVHTPATAGDYMLWRQSLRSFEALAAYRPTAVTLDVRGAGPAVPAVEASASTFEILGVTALLGRALSVEDERPGAPLSAVIGHDLWRSQYGGTPDIIGRAIMVRGESASVVGVMPPGFRFPTSHQVWVPLRVTDDGGPRTGSALIVFGRLAPRETAAAAEAELQALTSSVVTREPDSSNHLRAAVLPAWHLTFDFPSPGGLRALPEFPLVQLLMLAPLAVACINVGLLILAQTSSRAPEFAVRTAVGASRGRILSQVFVEFLVLAVAAAGVGLIVLDWLSARALTAFGVGLPYGLDTALTTRSIVRALLLAAGSAVVAGVVPAAWMTSRSIDMRLRRTGGGRAGTTLRGVSSVLVVVDVAVAVIAIAVAGGIWGKVQATLPNPIHDGVRAEQVLAVTFDVPSASSAEAARAQAAFVDRLRREPAVRGVTFATALPRMDHPVRTVEVQHDVLPGQAASTERRQVRTSRVAVDFFTQLGRPLVAGREFDARDLAPGARAIVVNTTFAQRAFGAIDVVGRRMRTLTTDGAPDGDWLEIVGVVGPMGVHALTPNQDDGVYLPLAEGAANPVRVAIWGHGDAAALAGRVRTVAAAADASAVVSMPLSLADTFEGDWYLLNGVVAAALLLVAVLLSLATSALYAILSLVVLQRTREIGIRVALGASRGDIVRVVARRAVAQIAVGVLLGLPVAGLVSYEYLGLTGLGPSVPAAAAMAAGLGASVLVLVSMTACAAPTLRALRIAPTEAMRAEV